MATFMQSEPSFVFVNSDVGNLNKSKLSRTLVRSQAARAARSTGPRSKAPDLSAKAPKVSIRDLGIDVDDEVSRNDSASMQSTASRNLIRRQDRALREQKQARLLVEPSNPVLLVQPLLMETYSPLLITHCRLHLDQACTGSLVAPLL